MRSLGLLALGPVLVLVSCRPPEAARADMLRDARAGCERRDASSCFLAGSLADEETGGAPRALKFHERGCALGHGGSCDAIAASQAPEREGALSEACNAGDLLSCTRLADGYPKDPASVARAKDLHEGVCRMSLAVKGDASSRALAGMAAGCGRLSALAASADPVRALRLDALATTLRTEALARLERDEDARTERALAARLSTVAEKNTVQREAEAAKRARQALLLEASGAAPPGSDTQGGPPLTPIERAYLGRASASLLAAASTAGADDAATCREAGDAIACAIAARAADKSDPAAALDLHVAGCSKRPDQCWSLVAYAEALLRRRDAARGAQVLDRGCEARAPIACARLGAELELGERGVAQDLGKAARAYDRGCEAGSARACAALAALVEDGRGVAKNPARARTLRAKADGLDRPAAAPAVAVAAADEELCRKGKDAAKCAAAAAAAADIDAVKAEELLRVGCAASAPTCGLWSFAIDRFRKDDASRGMRLLDQGCQGGAPLACHVLADVLHLGYRAIPRAEPKAAEAYARACELGDAGACRAAAARLRAAKNAAKADELRERAQKADDEAEKAQPDDGSRWARDAAEQRARGPHAAELERARAAWRGAVERATERERLRAERRESGGHGSALPPRPADEQAQAAAREAAIKKDAAQLLGTKR